jgi:hypothetical protein
MLVFSKVNNLLEGAQYIIQLIEESLRSYNTNTKLLTLDIIQLLLTLKGNPLFVINKNVNGSKMVVNFIDILMNTLIPTLVKEFT